MKLRTFQLNDKHRIYQSWKLGNKAVLYILPTGGGKTVVLSSIISDNTNQHQIIIAHRQELIGQISLSLAAIGIEHNIITSDKLIKEFSTLQIENFQRSYINPYSITTIAGVDTLLRRINKVDYQQWAKKIKMWIIDEAHHVLKTNKWGKVLQSFPNANGLGVTATPTRQDGYGLGSTSNGLFNTMIIGPSMSDLTSMGFLTPYRIFCPPSNLDLSKVGFTNSGDFAKPQVVRAIEKSTITGDTVKHYLKYANNIRGLTFCTDVKSAKIITNKYNNAGIPAMLVTAKTPIKDRINASKKLKSGNLLQLVNVDVFGEGYDLPSVGCISFLRPTTSLNLYMQQFGRGLRITEGKISAIILDHVGNVERHGFPDMFRQWSLESKRKQTKSTLSIEPIITICTTEGCFAPYDSRLTQCPYCNTIKTIHARTTIKQVSGDLTELHIDTIERLKLKRKQIDNPPMAPTNKGEIVRLSVLKRQRIRREKQNILRNIITQWAGNLRFMGNSDSKIYRIFYNLTGVSILEAQALGGSQLDLIIEKLQG